MVFAINCGADGSQNSFTNFKNSALAIGAQLKAEAASSSVVATPSATPAASAPPAATHTVTVGANGALAYSPNKVTAAINDVVVFEL